MKMIFNRNLSPFTSSLIILLFLTPLLFHTWHRITSALYSDGAYIYSAEEILESDILALGQEARIKEINIIINPPEEYDFKTKDEILNIRKNKILKYPQLLKTGKEYMPSWSIFGQMIDGKPWWGLLGYSYYGDGIQSIEGASEESRFISNPFLLVGLSDKYARRINDKSIQPQIIYPEPQKLTWKPSEKYGEVSYNITDFWNKYYEAYHIPEFQLREFSLVLYNASDLGLHYFYIDLKKSKNVLSFRKNKPKQIYQYIHCGGSCGYPGGGNNMSPNDSENDIKIKYLPGSLYIKLWKNFPDDLNNSPDMIFIINIR